MQLVTSAFPGDQDTVHPLLEHPTFCDASENFSPPVTSKLKRKVTVIGFDALEPDPQEQRKELSYPS